jgi:hypothetical protein
MKPMSFRGIATVVLSGLIFAACSSSAATGAPTVTSAPTPTIEPTASVAAETATPELSPLAGPTGVPTSLDPCQLVTAQEASALSGGSFTAGVESTTSGNGKICTYGGRTLNVFEVIVAQAPDVATAQAGKAEAQAALAKQAPKGLKFTELPSLADGAAYFSGSVTISGQSIGAGAIYVLKGTIFFGFSDLNFGHAPISAAALQTEAQTILGRLP